MNALKLSVGSQYQIAFMDPNQPDYTWFSGVGTFVRESAEYFGTGEQHFIFSADGDEECCFPESSIGRKI